MKMTDESIAKDIIEDLREFDYTNDELIEILRIAVNLLMFENFEDA